jgi:glucan biosynthesis protein C
MESRVESPQASGKQPYVRLHYLDWLRVLAILMVFSYHAVHPFDMMPWQIKNAEQSEFLTVIIVSLGLFGMPFFFLVAGEASWFALRRRKPSQFISERVKRLLIPFFVGCVLFIPVMLYLDWRNKTWLGSISLSLREYAALHFDSPVVSPRFFGIGYQLWFLGFLFCFALFALPLFLWLKTGRGQRLLSGSGRLCEHRGGILVFIIPLVCVKWLVLPFYPLEHDWADFTFQLSFFILGYMLFAEERITAAVRRDGWLAFAASGLAWLVLFALYLVADPFAWSSNPGIPQFYLVQVLVAVNAWGWSLFAMFLGMRFLDFTNRWLEYGQRAALPFFVLHQPVIIVIAFFVVQWQVGIPAKMLVVVPGSFLATLAVYELAIRRVRPMRALFGMTRGAA